jgi:hypothetical protein
VTSFRLLTAALALTVLAPASARAEGACSTWIAPALAEGPVPFGFQSADVATGRRACPRTELGLGLQGNAIIETQNLYGALTGSGLVSGSLAVRSDVELFALLEVPRFQYVQNASLTGSRLTLGQLTAGGTWVALSRGAFVLSPSVRLQLPTSFASPRTRTAGAELGAALLYRAWERLGVHGYAGVDSELGLGASIAQPRAGFLVNVGAEYALASVVAAVLDANVHFGRRAAVDYVAPSVGVRLRAGPHFGAEVGVSLPVAGPERALAAGGLKLTWRL